MYVLSLCGVSLMNGKPVTKCRSVLIVEDDNDIRESLVDLVELEGCAVLQATNGKEALELLKVERPCLILLDLFMPIMSGFEFLSARSHDYTIATIPVVVVSAVAEEAQQKTENVAAYIKKPLDLDSILSVVRKFCCNEAG
jgi:CheY-like chemotaxis protein